MTMKNLSRGLWLMLVQTLLIAGLAGPLPAQDKTVPKSPDGTVAVPKPAAAKEAAPAGATSLRISGAAFRPRTGNVDFTYFLAGSMYATNNPMEWWTAPVYLPQGAVVSSVRMFYYDGNAAYDCNGIFGVYEFANENVFLNPMWSSSGSAGLGYADSAAIDHTVDNTKYAYLLQWQPNVADSTMRLQGFQIFFTAPPGRAAVISLD
jgi:hypothetical protein